MPVIRQYEVIAPPTSQEVEDLALNKIRNREMLDLRIKASSADIPDIQEERDVVFRIKGTQQPEGGGMKVLGETALQEAVHLLIFEDSTKPAEVSIVSGE